MEILLNILVDPIVIAVVGFIITGGFFISQYDIHFEDGEEIEI